MSPKQEVMKILSDSKKIGGVAAKIRNLGPILPADEAYLQRKAREEEEELAAEDRHHAHLMRYHSRQALH